MIPRNIREGQKLRSTVWALTGRAIRAEGEIKGMAITLKDKKNKGKGRGKGLMDELRAEGKSNFLFLSPKKIARAKELKIKQEQVKQVEAAAKREKKAQATVAKEKKKLESQQNKLCRLQAQLERAAAREEKRSLAKGQRDDAAATRQLYNKLKSVKKSPKYKGTGIGTYQSSLVEVVERVGDNIPILELRRSGRNKITPKHLRDYKL
jgi:hypothetical protein